MRSKFRILIVFIFIGLLLPVNEGFAASPGKGTSYRHLLFSDLVYRNMDGCENKTVSVCADDVVAKRMKKEVEGFQNVKKYLQKQLSLPKNKRDGRPDSNDDASLLRKIKSTDTYIKKSQEKLAQFNNWVIKKGLKKYSGKWKVILVKGKSSSAFYGAAFQDPATKNVVISFRGSQETIDWINDAQTIAKFIPSAEEKQVPDAANFVKDVYTKTKGAKFIITGHSLGGFLTQRMALEIQGNPGNFFYKKYNANFSDFLKNKFQYAETFNAPGFFSDNTSIGKFKKKLALLEDLSGGPLAKGLSNVFLGYRTGKYVKPIKGVKGVYYRVYDHTFKDEPIGNFGFQLGGAAYYANNYKNKFDAHGKANFYKVTLKAPPINTWDKKAPSTPKVKTVTDKSTYVKGTANKSTLITIWYIQRDKKGNNLWYKMVSGYADKKGNFSIKIKPQKAGRMLYVTAQDKAVNLSPAASIKIKASAASYAMNISKSYTQRYYNGDKVFSEFTLVYKGKYIGNDTSKIGSNRWGEKGNSWDFILEKETKNGLYEYGSLLLSYPLKKGKRWTSTYLNEMDAIEKISYEVISTNNTVTTLAGTFKNVIKIKVDNLRRYDYYAAGYGIILSENNGMKTFELVKVK